MHKISHIETSHNFKQNMQSSMQNKAFIVKIK